MGNTVAAQKKGLQDSPCFTCRLADYFSLRGAQNHLSMVRCRKLGLVAIHTKCKEAVGEVKIEGQAA
jgi:hypothetical protein